MTYWNHRVMKRVFENGNSEYGIHEVYYNDDGKVEAWTENFIAPAAENIKELKQTLEWMAVAVKKPILDYANGKEIKPRRTKLIRQKTKTKTKIQK